MTLNLIQREEEEEYVHADASESRWSVRTGADAVRNGLPSARTERPRCGLVGFGGVSRRYKGRDIEAAGCRHPDLSDGRRTPFFRIGQSGQARFFGSGRS